MNKIFSLIGVSTLLISVAYADTRNVEEKVTETESKIDQVRALNVLNGNESVEPVEVLSNPTPEEVEAITKQSYVASACSSKDIDFTGKALEENKDHSSDGKYGVAKRPPSPICESSSQEPGFFGCAGWDFRGTIGGCGIPFIEMCLDCAGRCWSGDCKVKTTVENCPSGKGVGIFWSCNC